MKKAYIYLSSLFSLMMLAGCDPLDKTNLAALSSEDVLTNPKVAEAYVNDMYANFMPSSFSVGRLTDETMVINGENAAGLSDYLKGTLTADTYNDFPYENIRKINIFLAQVDNATFDENIKKSLKGEALFWRAFAYFRMVKAYGGVELILKPESPANKEAIFVPRSKTSECIAQIVKDLDEAIPLVEPLSTIGRIDKGAAMSFKGRVLLYWASPQFNRSNDLARWTAAYNASKDALTFLDANGKGLYANYKDLWTNEMNKEVIMVKRFQYPGFSNGYSQAGMRPLLYSRGAVGDNVPSLELVNAYPMKDGSKYNPATMDYKTLFKDRDKRFYASIAYNGAEPYLAEMFGKENMWTYFYDADGNAATGINGKEARADNSENLFSHSSFYPAKMLDRNITRTTVEDGQVDWIEIRYAEVLMNMAEAANEIGKTSEALAAMYKIRNRAGIEPGAKANYGITAATLPDIRKAIMDERLVEFAFEGQRFWDLRRWRVYTSTFNSFKDKYFHGLRVEWNGTAADRPKGLVDINTIANKFTITEVRDYQPIVMLEEDKYSFFGIPKAILDRSSKIEQNKSWGGTFDPLQ
ncbi:RagB/SusD family nutrient uptake outer membrane protein [Dyadobacter sp. CY327]|uniref:RagB/SusD family nutrient uptake outer membrane protein n=1 Tax=Dyadobacter sp. CY327 TaxID=2907301 RepID=UPI001F220DC4|nr:RagB/SusD family nutrient uptake outer membrane protein [Dyadobacter sp. CY327]MCE7069094.1 RagB/SusD family nutrient uptake outer membrane protein [Dyadobacter sp. CY327]